MSIVNLIEKSIISKKIDSISNQEYQDYCSKYGKKEIDKILKEYAESQIDAHNIYVRWI